MPDSESLEKGTPREGRYANYCDVAHTAKEFVFDFGQFYQPESTQAHIHTRVVIIPVCAKALLETLQNNVLRYEESFGEIQDE